MFNICGVNQLKSDNMLLRVSLQNFFSFKEQTEFNLFPSSRTMQLTGHIVLQDYAKVLRMSAVYGANGAGKSNLVKAVSLVRRMVVAGTVDSVSSVYYRCRFCLTRI